MNSNKLLWVFLIKCLALYLVWFLLYELWLKPAGEVDFMLTAFVTKVSTFILNFVDHRFSYLLLHLKHYIALNGKKILGIANPCNGLVLYPLFCGFVIATPGSWKKRLVMMTCGCMFIFFLNIFRILMLTWIQIKSPEYLDFNHKYTFTVFVYGVIFGLWMIWINWSREKKGNLKVEELKDV